LPVSTADHSGAVALAELRRRFLPGAVRQAIPQQSVHRIADRARNDLRLGPGGLRPGSVAISGSLVGAAAAAVRAAAAERDPDRSAVRTHEPAGPDWHAGAAGHR